MNDTRFMTHKWRFGLGVLGRRGRLVRDLFSSIYLFIEDSSLNTIWEFDRCSFDGEVHIVCGLKLKFHRRVDQLRCHPSPPRKTRSRRCFVRKWRACEDDDYVHAKRNDKDVPRNSRTPKNGKPPSHSVVVRNKVTNCDRTVI